MFLAQHWDALIIYEKGWGRGKDFEGREGKGGGVRSGGNSTRCTRRPPLTSTSLPHRPFSPLPFSSLPLSSISVLTNPYKTSLRFVFVFPIHPQYLVWLICKVEQAAAALAEEGSDALRALDEPSRLQYAIGLISEYTSEDHKEELLSFFGLGAGAAGAAGAAARGEELEVLETFSTREPSAKRQKLDPKEIARERAAIKAKEKKEEELKRQTKGMKSIASFFGGGGAAKK
jgi:hypothetical protein